MKKLIFVLMLLLAACAVAQVVGVDPFDNVPPVAAAKTPFTSLVIITEIMAGYILTGTQGMKRLLESPLLKWALRIWGHGEVVPYIAVALTIVNAIIAGVIANQAGGITVGELLAMIPLAWGQALGTFSLAEKAGGKR